ncbi:hypothetical protein DICVIV_01262 [Dictyocaulus viviparus]|uniref:THAP-type domain-containing protein n=1 Tax=Dictyocaulus viviparus TaxID=29172 RepID=A0A0D8Y8L3_DICVI|nr:hypothetical protein DICVIV_01262 [Dictyocaulus viviparus]
MFVGKKLEIECSPLCNGFTQQHWSVTNLKPISIVDNVESENEEEEYEEMEDDEEDDNAFLFPHSTRGQSELDPATKNTCSTFPCCLVCGRISTPKIRLFKWPEDLQLRRSWLKFFRLSLDSFDNCQDPYICNIHFDADQFLCEGDRIFWKRNPFPSFQQRRSIMAEPFPWEIEQNISKKSKASHPVAVVSLPENPNIFYEFSYTRTSPIDFSKFYSCLTCRRAKTDNCYWTSCKIYSGPVCQETQDHCTKLVKSTNHNEVGQSSSMHGNTHIANLEQTPFSGTKSLDFCSEKPSQNKVRGHQSIFTPASLRKSRQWHVRQRWEKRPLPQCHLCRRVLPSTELLVQHLLNHIKLRRTCSICGSKLSPDQHVRMRRMKICSMCSKKCGR